MSDGISHLVAAQLPHKHLPSKGSAASLCTLP